jgi:diketogulonate reductase-like aldo/keto reductase
MERYYQSLARSATEEYAELAKKHGLTPTQLALAWCRSRWWGRVRGVSASNCDALRAAVDWQICCAVVAMMSLPFGHNTRITPLDMPPTAPTPPRRFVRSTIIGATSLPQLKENLDAFSVELSPEVRPARAAACQGWRWGNEMSAGASNREPALLGREDVLSRCPGWG